MYRFTKKKKNRYGTGTLPVLLRHKNVAKCDNNNVILYMQPEMTNISSPFLFLGKCRGEDCDGRGRKRSRPNYDETWNSPCWRTDPNFRPSSNLPRRGMALGLHQFEEVSIFLKNIKISMKGAVFFLSYPGTQPLPPATNWKKNIFFFCLTTTIIQFYLVFFLVSLL